MIAIVPVRLRSAGAPIKNLRALGGLPLFLQSVVYGRQEGIRTVVATPDPAVRAVCERFGVPCYMGEAASAQGDMLGMLRKLAADSTADDHFALLQPTSPFRTPGLLAGLCRRIQSGSVPGYFTARKCKPQGLRTDEDGTRHALNAGRRQDCKSWLHLADGNLYVFTRAALEGAQNGLLTDDWQAVEQSGLATLDIDTPEDFALAERLAESPAAADLLPARDGMRIAIVSNCPYWPEDMSSEVDSADLVVRVNDLTSLDTGRTGKRTDVAVVLPGTNYIANPAANQHGDALRAAQRVIFARQIATDKESCARMQQVAHRHALTRWAPAEESFGPRCNGRTTFFEATLLCTRYFPHAEITLYGDRAAATRAIEHAGFLADVEDREFDSLTAEFNLTWVTP